MKISFRMTSAFVAAIRADLRKRHAFARERVGFISAKPSTLPEGGLSFVAFAYHAVDDGHYIRKRGVGAYIGPDALRTAMQRTYQQEVSTFHVHLHDHVGRPWFSDYDLSESAKFVPDFFNVASGLPHGALVLSADQAAGICWTSKVSPPFRVNEFVEVGGPMRFFWS